MSLTVNHLSRPYTIFCVLIISPWNGACYFTLKREKRRQHSYINFSWPVKCHGLFWFAAAVVVVFFSKHHTANRMSHGVFESQKEEFTFMQQDMKIHCFEQNIVHDKDYSKDPVGHHRGHLEATAIFRQTVSQHNMPTSSTKRNNRIMDKFIRMSTRLFTPGCPVTLSNMYKLRCCHLYCEKTRLSSKRKKNRSKFEWENLTGGCTGKNTGHYKRL